MSISRLEDISFSYHTYGAGMQMYGFAQHNGHSIGEMKADLHPRKHYIDLFWLVVNKDCRGRGIATEFLSRLNDWGRANSVVEICCAILPTLLVDISSDEYGVALTKMGFTRTPVYGQLFRKKIE